MTLVETMVALLVGSLVFAGIIGGLVQARQLTARSVAQATVEATVESYMEQMKSMPLQNLICPTGAPANADGSPSWTKEATITIQTATGNDTLIWSDNGSTTTIPPFSDLIPGVTHPAGVVDNLKELATNPQNPGAPTTWKAIWPYAANLPATGIPSQNNLHLNVWVWVTDLSDPDPATTAQNTNGNAQAVYGLTIIYTWQFYDGLGGTRYFMGSLHAIRSSLS
jgi:hypothetical protein